jgi:hypothetical protein
MKRRLLKLAVFLLLGAIVNVAVAWGCALFALDGDARFGVTDLDAGLSWVVESRQRPGGMRLLSLWPRTDPVKAARLAEQRKRQRAENPFDPLVQSSDPRAESLIPKGLRSSIHEGVEQLFDVRGWPCLALRCELDRDATIREHDYVWRGGISVEPDTATYDPRGARVLPVQPIWPDFAINTLFYAAILWLLFAAPLKLRRWRRSRRGLCPACAYPVGSSSVCTECGRPITGRQIDKSTSQHEQAEATSA